jgi:hypothetical protein
MLASMTESVELSLIIGGSRALVVEYCTCGLGRCNIQATDCTINVIYGVAFLDGRYQKLRGQAAYRAVTYMWLLVAYGELQLPRF